MTRNEWLENFEAYKTADAAFRKAHATLCAMEEAAGTDDMDDAAFDAFYETGEAKELAAKAGDHGRLRAGLLKKLYTAAPEFVPAEVGLDFAAAAGRVVWMEKIVGLVAKGLAA